MATRRSRTAKKPSVHTVDFTGVDSSGGSFHIKEGRYLMKVLEVEKTESKSSGEDMFKWTFEGLEKAAKGKKFFVYTTLNEEALWKLRSLLEALGVEVPDGPLDIDLEEMVDLELIGIVTDDTYEGKEVSRMNDFESADGAGEEEEEEELEEKTPGRSRKKTPTGRGKKTTKKDEPEPISADEVRGMGEDELSDLVEKYELEVDLDEHKTLRRKVNAVVTALEEAELIED